MDFAAYDWIRYLSAMAVAIKDYPLHIPSIPHSARPLDSSGSPPANHPPPAAPRAQIDGGRVPAFAQSGAEAHRHGGLQEALPRVHRRRVPQPRRHGGDAKARLRLAGDYAYLLASVHHYKDLLFSYNIAVDRLDEMKKILDKSAASVGLQLPDVYQS
ncbi:hypothetical protein ABZP36_009856 [Zizania latifolia]